MKLRFSRIFVYFIFANVLVLFSNLHLFLNIWHVPPKGYIYPFIHREASDDYYSYLAYITEGQHGHWLKRDPYTTEKTTPGILHIYYIFTGKLTGIVQSDAAITYHLARIVSLEIFLLSIFLICRTLGKKHILLTSILCLIATIPPSFLFNITINTSNYPFEYPWFLGFDALERLYMPPHHIFGQAMFLFSLVFLFLYFTRKLLRFIGVSAIILLIGALTYPPIILPVSVSLILASFVYVARHIVGKIVTDIKPIIVALMFLLGTSFIIFLLISYQQSFGYPWSESKNYELGYWNTLSSFDREFIFTLLPSTLFAIPFLISQWRTKDFRKLFLIAWAFTPFVLLPVASLLGIPKIRLINATTFIPFAIMAIYSIGYFKTRMMRVIFLVLIFIVYGVSLVEFTGIKFRSIQYYLFNNPINSFRVPVTLLDAFFYIDTTLPKDSRIFSSQETGVMLPGYAPVISFIGHVLETYDFVTKLTYTKDFYGGSMGRDAALSLFQQHDVEYVLFGPYERKLGGVFFPYDFLVPIYVNQDVTLYQVIPNE